LTEIQARLQRASEHVLAPLSARQRDIFLNALHTIVANLGRIDSRTLCP
jgi:hypothetical protein